VEPKPVQTKQAHITEFLMACRELFSPASIQNLDVTGARTRLPTGTDVWLRIELLVECVECCELAAALSALL
jgi:hypothetical protein